MMRLKPALIALLVLGSALALNLWRRSQAGTALSYVLTPVPEGVRVELTIRTPFDEVALRPITYDLLLPMEDLEAFAADGSPLPLERVPADIRLNQSLETPLTRYLARPPGDFFTVRYLARPPVFKIGPACAPVKRYALAGAAPGSSLFLVTDGPIRSLAVRCAQAGGLEPLNDLPVQEALDRIPETVLLAGEARTENEIRLHVSPLFDPEERRLVLDWLKRLQKGLKDRLGPAPVITLMVLPPQGDEILSVSDLSPDVLVAELNPRNGVGKQNLAEGLALRWLGKSPEAAIEGADPHAWFSVGLARLAAHRALRGIGEDWAGDKPLAAAFTARFDISLQEPPDRESDLFKSYASARRIKAPCAVMLLGWELERLTGGRSSLRDLWPLVSSGTHPDIEQAAVALAGPGIRPFFNRWVRQENSLLHPFPFLARPNPYGPVSPTEKPAPDLRLLLTGYTQAYLETCGCKMSQSGGIARRQTALLGARKDGVPMLTLDLGGFFPYSTKPGELDALSEMEIRFSLDAMERMGYSAAALGMQETLHGREFLERMLQGGPSPPCLSADLDLAPAALPYLLVKAGTLEIGLVGVTGNPAHWEGAVRFNRALHGITAREPGAVAAAVKAARSAGADRVFLMGSMSTDLLDALDSAGAAPDLALDPETHPLWSDVSGQTPPLWMGTYKGIPWVRSPKGSYGLSVLDLAWAEGPAPLRADLAMVDLDERVPDDPGIRRRLDAFYGSLADQPGVWKSFEPLFPWDPGSHGRFAGVQTCQTCHPRQHDQWKGTKHSDAMRILVQEHRNFNPKCVVCHVTGMGREGGYVLSAVQHPMENVQCEVCHGSGAAHAAAPSRGNIRKTPPKAVCLECHNPEHSDHFDKRFPDAWEKVRH